jgi:hypothetical protein
LFEISIDSAQCLDSSRTAKKPKTGDKLPVNGLYNLKAMVAA